MTSPRLDLIELRRALGFTQATLATALDVQVTTVARWEQGVSRPRGGYREPLAKVLGVGLLELDRLLNPQATVALPGHKVPGWLTHYESLVMEAGQLAQVELLILPALLQTPAYASVIERHGPLPLTDGEVIERVDRRLARQAVLDREPDPLRLLAVISESVLRKTVGTRAVMAEQLDHLIAMSEQRANVEIQVIPADGRDACAVSGFELLSTAGEAEPFMVCTFDVGGARYWEDSYHRDKFVTMFNHLSSVALLPGPSVELIREIRESH
jgi:transcriptional regulator with XRE-family HTH domain